MGGPGGGAGGRRGEAAGVVERSAQEHLDLRVDAAQVVAGPAGEGVVHGGVEAQEDRLALRPLRSARARARARVCARARAGAVPVPDDACSPGEGASPSGVACCPPAGTPRPDDGWSPSSGASRFSGGVGPTGVTGTGTPC